MRNETKFDFPGGSKTKVNESGERVRLGNFTTEDIQIIDKWREAHRAVLNTFQAILRNRTRGKNITVAQRHKRKKTIFDKLRRLPEMKLSRMDDVAGCRLIFKNIDELYTFRENFHKARFNHKLRNEKEKDKYDYIKKPKQTGYRGIHDVYEYDVKSSIGRQYTGLLVEIQYRTLVQHAWATAVELIGFITESQPKFQKGDKRYEKAMALSSEILSRSFENLKGPFPDLNDKEVVSQFLRIDNELHLIKMLKGLNYADKTISNNRNVIFIFSRSNELQVKTFRDATDALRALFELEKKFPGQDILLVRADSSDDIRLAFKNYFSDARDFLKFVEEGSCKLSSRSARCSSPRRKAT